MGKRIVSKIVSGMPTSDGAGVNLYRVMGTPMFDGLDPFLMLDEFKSDDKSDYIAGFPPHPHRGFETVTYMKNGRFRHEDSVGNSGLLEDGSIQWMTAGRGIIHSEMPEMSEGQLWGYQLWINLPSHLKMSAPDYQDIPADRLPIFEDDKVWIKVLAGTWQDQKSPVRTLHPVNYLDVLLKTDQKFQLDLVEDWNCFIYVYDGAIRIGDEQVSTGQAGQLTIGTELEVCGPAGFLLFASPPIGEVVVKHGPFVMNTVEQINQAIDDYNAGTFAK